MLRLLLATALLGSAAAATAATVVVNATNDLYNVGSGGFDGTAPQAIDVTGLTSITFSVSPGATVTVNGGGNLNDADGVGAASGENVSGGNGISGITAPTAGFIAGAFVGSTLSPTAPAALNFNGATSFASLAPQLQQAFFIGDGRTGDASGATQTFYVPTGAKTLYLGLTDACGYNGSPSCFGDNGGSFTLTATGVGAGTVPEPAAWALMLVGFGATGLAVRRRGQAVVTA